MKCSTPSMYLFAGAFIALIAIYIGFTMLRTTYEGLGNSADSGNVVIVAKTKKIVDDTNATLTTLTGDPTSYINLLTSYKNKGIVDAIKTTVDSGSGTTPTSSFSSIADYDEAIDYLKTLGVSDTVVTDPAIGTVITTNNTATNAKLTDLTADNQAYIDLLISYKNKAMSTAIVNATTTTPLLKISEYNDMIEYLRTMGGIVGQEPTHVPTTRNISLSPP